MIYSMTAFARVQDNGAWGSLVCEIRSVNHRYLEMGIYLPEVLRTMEMSLRERIRQRIRRGKVECTFRYQPGRGAENALFSLNPDMAQALCQTADRIAALMQQAAPVSPADIMRFPGVLETKETESKQLQTAVLNLLDGTLSDLLAARAREGDELRQLFLDRAALIERQIANVRERSPHVLMELRERLVKKCQEAKLELDPGRLEQEMVLFAQKMDVLEEIERAETHVAEIRRILNEGGLVGRRMDFLLQELNRETNTLGSKSMDATLAHAVVEMKVLIEQIREQVQNVE